MPEDVERRARTRCPRRRGAHPIPGFPPRPRPSARQAVQGGLGPHGHFHDHSWHVTLADLEGGSITPGPRARAHGARPSYGTGWWPKAKVPNRSANPNGALSRTNDGSDRHKTPNLRMMPVYAASFGSWLSPSLTPSAAPLGRVAGGATRRGGSGRTSRDPAADVGSGKRAREVRTDEHAEA